MALYVRAQADYQFRLHLSMPIYCWGHLTQFPIDQFIALAVIGQLLELLSREQFFGDGHDPSSSDISSTIQRGKGFTSVRCYSWPCKITATGGCGVADLSAVMRSKRLTVLGGRAMFALYKDYRMGS